MPYHSTWDIRDIYEQELDKLNQDYVDGLLSSKEFHSELRDLDEWFETQGGLFQINYSNLKEYAIG